MIKAFPLSFGSVVGSLFSIALAHATPTMDLKALVNYGLEHSPQMKISQNNLKMSELTTSNAVSQFLPSLDVSATSGYRDSAPAPRVSPWAADLSLTLSETLYDNGSNLIAYDIADLNEDKASLEFIRDREHFCLAIAKAYYSYSQAVEQLKVQEFQYKLLSTQFTSIEGKYRRGEKTRTEYLRFKARLKRSSLSLKSAKNIISKSTEEIKALIGFHESEILLSPQVPVDRKINKTLSDINIANHIENKISEIEKRVKDLEIRRAERKHLPEISAVAGVSYSNLDYFASNTSFLKNGSLEWSALLNVKYSLWDWGTKKRNLAIAEIDRDTSDNTIEAHLLSLKAETAKLALNLNQLIENNTLNKDLVELERTNFTSLESDYRNGRANFLNLVNAVDNLTNAQDLYLRNYYELSESLAEYYFHQGKLYESIITH